MDYQALARTWRPKQFESVVGQEHVLPALIYALTHQRLHHAYLFTGTRGVGKTSIARIFAKCLNCETGITATPCNQCSTCLEIDAGCFMDLIEVDAASRTKVEDTRELLDKVSYAPAKGRFKIYLIDEVHMLSGHSFNALLKTLEEPPSHVKFLLATTDPHKLPVTILSRCLQFHLKPLTDVQIVKQLSAILTKENMSYENSALSLLAHQAQGSLRDALGVLDQAIALGDGAVKENSVCTLLGLVDQTCMQSLLHALAEHDAKKLMALSEDISLHAYSIETILEKLAECFHHISVNQFIKNEYPEWQSFADTFSKELVQLYYQICLMGRKDLALAPTPKVGLEITLLRLLAFEPSAPATHIVAPHKATEPKAILAPLSTTSDWDTLCSELKLSGMLQALAMECEMVQKTPTQISLKLAKAHATLLNENLRKRLQDAINQHLKTQLALEITLSQEPLNTPAARAQENKKITLESANKSIQSDSHVDTLMKKFGAKVKDDTITPL